MTTPEAINSPDASDDVVQQFFTKALKGLGYPVSQPPGNAEAETYVVFQEVSGSSYLAGNAVQRVRHLVQLHAYTHSEHDEHRTAFFAALAMLKKAGVRVFSWGPDIYEPETGIRHIACTCTWWQRPVPAQASDNLNQNGGKET